MPEHSIAGALVDRIRSGRAALVLGAGLGLPPWQHLLERMTGELDASDAARHQLAQVLQTGNLSRALSFLACALGDQRCERIVGDAWRGPDAMPAAVRALAGVPVRHIWTTVPGSLIETALTQHSPEGWPQPRVLSYRDPGLDRAGPRTVLKLFGDCDSYAVTPRAVRRVLAAHPALRELVRAFYRDGVLIFAGFCDGDPDLSALLDVVLGAVEPPAHPHYLLGAGLGPAAVAELAHRHTIEVVPLAGCGADEAARAALVEFFGALTDACAEAGVTLASGPAADDLEGWLGRLADDPTDAEAAAAVDAMAARARVAGDGERLIEIFMAKAETATDPIDRGRWLRELAGVFAHELSDPARAVTAMLASLRDDPDAEQALAAIEHLAAEADVWPQVVAEVTELAATLADPALAGRYWTRLALWYERELHHHDYATAAYRSALKADPRHEPAHVGVAEALRKQQRWAELADAIAAHLEVAAPAARGELWLSLGELAETQLASTQRAIDAYTAAASADAEHDDPELRGEALTALERLYRRDQRWGDLAHVLERRADQLEALGEWGRAAAVRRDRAALVADKLGDSERAICAYEAAVVRDPCDLAALRALDQLYAQLGRSDDVRRTLERLCDAAPEGERVGLLLRLAAELGDAMAQASPAEVAGLAERAIACHQRLLEIQPDHGPSSVALAGALAELYERTERWADAVDVLERRARLQGGQGGAESWLRAGQLAADRLADPDRAEQLLENALAIDPLSAAVLRALAEIHAARGRWTSALDRLIAAQQHTCNRLHRIELLRWAAAIADEQLDDQERSIELRQLLVGLDPDDDQHAERLAEQLVAARRWAEAAPVQDMLARRVDLAADERAGRYTALARTCEALDKIDEAARSYRAALQADPGALLAARGLAALEYAAATRMQTTAAWSEVERAYRSLVDRHAGALDRHDREEAWFRIGVSCRALGKLAEAQAALRQVSSQSPCHQEALREQVTVARARADWRTLIDTSERLIELADAGGRRDDQAALHEQIGDVLATELEDSDGALAAYQRALGCRPGAHAVLHKVLDIHTRRGSWRASLTTLEALAAAETHAARRAKYHYAAAVIARDELGDDQAAVAAFTAALDDDPTIAKATGAIDRLLSERGQWRELARSYRRMLKRLGEGAPSRQLLPLWRRLGDICLDHLGDPEAAVAAYEVASSLDPENLGLRETLANLYLEAGEDRADDAIDELQALLEAQPARIELYRALSDLYFDRGDVDRAYCMAQALGFLGAANQRERELYERHRPRNLILAKGRLTDELWQRAIIHRQEDRHLNAVFASLAAVLAAMTARPNSSFKLPARTAADHSNCLAARVFGYAANVMGLEQVPRLYIVPDADDAVQVANTSDKGKLAPSVVLGGPELNKSSEEELAFDLGKRLAILRPEHYVKTALQTLPRIEVAFRAALSAADAGNGDDHPEVAELAQTIRDAVAPPVLEQIRVVADQLRDRADDQLVATWLSVTELTANRAGFILCNDFETAARAVAVEDRSPSSIDTRARLRDLLAYSVSEPYFQVRRHLGVTIQA
jgi:golgin subfamily B member 1